MYLQGSLMFMNSDYLQQVADKMSKTKDIAVRFHPSLHGFFERIFLCFNICLYFAFYKTHCN